MFYFRAGGQGTVFRDQALLPLYNTLEIELGAPGLCSSHLSPLSHHLCPVLTSQKSRELTVELVVADLILVLSWPVGARAEA